MKVLCIYTDAGPSYVRTGWGRVFKACGHEFTFWKQSTPAFDAFSKVEPDLFIGTTYDLDRATIKNIVSRPNMKVILFASAWGPYLKDVDLKKYPLVVVSEQEKKLVEKLKKETGKPDFVFIHAHDRWLEGTMSGWRDIGVEPVGVLNAADTFDYLGGVARPELACDVAFVGGYWPYKAGNLNKYILPLCHPDTGLNVKLFGNSPWPVHQYLGGIENSDVRDLFASAAVCPNVSEPHSTDLGWDVIERPFKVLAAGGFCISDHVEEARDLFTDLELPMAASPAHLEQMIRYYLDHPETRAKHVEAGRHKVLLEHTYFDRVCQFFDHLGMPKESANVLRVKGELLKGAI
jgi:hypothetical protein